jgi:hypothetical protein
MELASMLAHERFSDHPKAVCPVIGSFLRKYNDGIDDERRQDLYAVAAKVIGTRDRRARSLRARHCRARLAQSQPIGASFGLVPQPARHAASACASAFLRAGAHAEALAFIDELVAVGHDAPDPVAADAGEASRPAAGAALH